MRLNIVSHFGTRFSYATHATTVARALRDAGLLGRLYNIDASIHPDYADLEEHFHCQADNELGLVIAVPCEPNTAFAHAFRRCAIFACPNTTKLSRESAASVRAFDVVITPSRYCAGTVMNSFKDMPDHPDVVILPLGGESPVFAGKGARIRKDRALHGSDHRANFLHLTTDFYQPGRKGTSELLTAWKRREDLHQLAFLTLHAPSSAYSEVLYLARDQGFSERDVQVVSGPTLGTSKFELSELLDTADALVQPSRCEGFGMIIASALLHGVPLVATRCTGHWDFMSHFPEQYLECATDGAAELHGEDGIAPTIDIDDLGVQLAHATDPMNRLAMMRAAERNLAQPGANTLTWGSALGLWSRFVSQGMRSAAPPPA